MEPPTSPLLRPHRLLPGEAGSELLEGLSLDVVEDPREGWLAASHEAWSPALASAAQALAEQTWLSVEKAALMLAALPARLQAASAPDVALQRVALVGALLQALPPQMAAGLETSVAQVHGLFAQLLNAPGHSGVIEQVIDALAALGTADGPLAEHDAAIEVLREVHRDLVTLRQTWNALVEVTFLEAFPELARPLLASDIQVEPAGPAAGAQSRALPPQASRPLAVRGVVVQPASGGAATRSFRFRAVRKQRQGLAVGMAVLSLVLFGAGMMLLHGRGAPSHTSEGAAFSGKQHTPLVTTPPTPAQPQLTPTPPGATLTPRAPTPSPQPTPPTSSGSICPTGSAFCVSTLQLQITCTGAGSGTIQLLNNTVHKASWRADALPGPGGAQLTISPPTGKLKPAQLVSLTVQTSTPGQTLLGTIMITGPADTAPIMVVVHGCG